MVLNQFIPAAAYFLPTQVLRAFILHSKRKKKLQCIEQKSILALESCMIIWFYLFFSWLRFLFLTGISNYYYKTPPSPCLTSVPTKVKGKNTFRLLGCQTALSLVPLCIVVHEAFCASELTMNIERMRECSN